MTVQWWQIAGCIVCIVLSGTFSGLTLGLMSLDIIDLRVLTESGTERERWYARRILPVRRNGNWLLCTLLIGNTAVNAALAIITAGLFGGIAGFLSSTIAILYVGEIIPQSVCHRFGLVIGAYAIPFVRIFMFLTAPLSFTTAKLLDWLLGGEPVTRYNKSQLKSLLSIHGTQAPDDESRRSQSDNSDNDTVHHPGNSDARQHTDTSQQEFTIVELPKISAQKDIKGEFTGVYSTASRSNRQNAGRTVDFVTPMLPEEQRPENGVIEEEGGVEEAAASSPQVSGADTDRQSRTRVGPLSRFYSLKRTKMGDKVRRKEKEREKKEKESVSSNPPLTRDEMAMVGGAFDFSQKTVAQVMTALDNVFMLEASLSLNFAVLLLIFQSGHSRVPVYDKARDNIIGVLFAKDLILLDPEDCVPIKTVLLFFNRTVLLVFYDTPLNKMLNIFKQGGGHMAIVRQNSVEVEGENPVPNTLGVVTLEDLIEELIGQDIVDETDVYTDNISKQRVKRIRSIDPEVLRMFDSKHDEELLSEKEVLVVASYLANNTHEFSEDIVKMKVLKDMLAEFPIVEYHDENRAKAHGLSQLFDGFAGVASTPVSDKNNATPSDSDTRDKCIGSNGLPPPIEPSKTIIHPHVSSPTREAEPDITIYSRGVPTKNAYLIINGRLEISAGNDGFISEAGPWTLLGKSALTDDLYAPDFTARVCERPARLLRIPRKLYRLMVQYSSVPIGGKPSLHVSRHSPTLKHEMVGLPRRHVSEGPGAHSPSSLALAAAATAVAVGNPSNNEGRPPLPGTASDAAVVRKSRSRRNGQSIEWSEMEPMQTAEATASVSHTRIPQSKSHTAISTMDIVVPMKGSTGGEPPSSGGEKTYVE